MTTTGRLPAISVVMPTFNRSAILGKVLAAWERQVPVDLPFEVVVVDDGSSDGTSEVIDAFETTRFSLVSLRQENAGPATARNYGLAAAAGEKVLFTGDDIEPSPDLLQTHLDAHSRTNGRWAVLGNVSWSRDLEITSTMRHVDGVGAQQFGFFYMTDGEEYDFRHFYTSNVSVDRAMLLREPSGFSTDFSACRVRGRGVRLPTAAPRHANRLPGGGAGVAPPPLHRESFFQRQVACGRMAAVLIRKWPEIGRDIGAQQVLRSRIRERLTFGAQRRRIDGLRGRLDDLEKAAVISPRALIDRPPTQSIRC